MLSGVHHIQSRMISGPYWKNNSRDSNEVILERRASSAGVKPFGRMLERRVKRTSVGIWSREEVNLKIFSAAKRGRDLKI